MGMEDIKHRKIIGSIRFHMWVKEHYKAEKGSELTITI